MRRVRFWVAAATVAAMAAAPFAAGGAGAALASAGAKHAAAGMSKHMAINCGSASAMCAEVANSDDVFGHYVGHDEPSALFYSHQPGSGNHVRYQLTLPTDPSPGNPTAPGKSFAFELSGADWFGMAICATQSFPEQVRTCPPDSNRNILSPAVSPKHVGEAFMELQFYPPGWVPWPTWAVAVGASACNPTKWCAAMNIFSLAINPVTGKTLNKTCLAKVGPEYVNFAFITRSGKTQAPANPVDSTLATFTPSSKELYMNSGDHVQLSLTDTKDGLKASLDDLTTRQTGSMTASAANGFAQVKFAPSGTSCTALPYNFHPMYSTSTPRTRVTWAAHSYNVAFDSEIGHFQFCTGPKKIPATPFGLNPNGTPTTCPKGDTQGRGPRAEPADGDDLFCFPGSEALVIHVTGCSFTNTGFDGVDYQPVWPNGNTQLHPTPFRFSSPSTGRNYSVQYNHAAFEADLPAIETATCNVVTGAGCTHIPRTDDGQPATFYPFYTTTNSPTGCVWQFGNNIPGQINNFGQDTQYGKLLKLQYTQKGGGSAGFFQDFRNILSGNPCPQGSS